MPDPTTAYGWYERGRAARESGDISSAIAAFNQALKLKADFIPACFDLATLLEQVAPLELAIKMYQYLLAILPSHSEGKIRLHRLQGTLKQLRIAMDEGFHHLHHGVPEQAALCFHKALALHPRVPDALSSLGLALILLRRLDEAQAAVSEALHLQPDHAGALAAQASLYHTLGRFDLAIASYRQIVSLTPGHFKAWINLGKNLQRLGDDTGAAEAYRGALRANPRHAEALAEMVNVLRRLCLWEDAQAHMAALVDVMASSTQCCPPFLGALYLPPPLQLENARHYASQRYPGGKPYDPARPLPAGSRRDGKLRIGYLSADFSQHATAYLISELFEQHDRSRFGIFAYSCGIADGSAEETRIRRSVDTFRDIRLMENRRVMDTIRSDGIDILVDLKGYTRDERMDLMALRSAPLQMHYLGYPSTTGACFIDYFITDAIASPPGTDAFFSEQLIRLPTCYQINDRKRPLPPLSAPRTHYGLPAEGFVFCSFNNAYKITPEVFAAWLRLLAAVPGSVLWLYETHAGAMIRLRAIAMQHGIDPQRLVGAPTLPLKQHLARYRYADLFLDTFPVCGHTTASDALWCGLPVVTMAGESFISRVAASLLAAVGLPQLVAADLAAYEALALDLAQNPEKVRQLRQHLEDKRLRLPLFDSTRTAQALEAAYEQAAAHHRRGLAPQAFLL